MKGIVYYIKSSHTPKVYVGSSTMTPEKRMCKHKYDFRCGSSITSREIMQYEDAYMEMIEELEDEDEDNLKVRLIAIEAHHIHTVDCVNKNIPGRTHAEWVEDNKEHVTEQRKIYDATPVRKEINKIRGQTTAHKTRCKTYNETPAGRESQKKSRDSRREQINAWKSVSILCECGIHYTQGHKARHFKSKMHIAYLKL